MLQDANKTAWARVHATDAEREEAVFGSLRTPCDRKAFDIVAKWPYDGPAGDGIDYAGEIINDLADNKYRIVPSDTIDSLVAALEMVQRHQYSPDRTIDETLPEEINDAIDRALARATGRAPRLP